ncbi:ribosome-associated ATPase/putative transporter RbbA [Paralimibaculum aggregatum]|uniref:Ribosome-associated ATPase/putative transporter RbbA n=1 Tax=Paralimibaculum aggregatum TaxID=3036245 RepID=A0ABQ6LMM7_9RHOB|nr:ribosome-associated ATPase/putative transporter RbbA [Limibaculum sp. NKW23]GMG82088.1 ribosome-associated ATPase/putative transporter RbbA [Limibaculum sp. NKW23]
MIGEDRPIARIRGVTHMYRGVRAIDGVTLDLPMGRMIGLLGPDGVGKSTLLGLLSGARRIQQGRIEVLGNDMASAGHRTAVGPRIAYMPQGLGKNLYADLSVEENLDFFGKLFAQGRSERRARIDRLTKATGLHPFLARPAGKLSGGMKQKLGLCCSLIHDPDFLILDEPTTGVDPLSRRQFWELIDAIREERTGLSVVVATAYMDEAERFDWLVAMNAGRVLDAGTPAELRRRTEAADLETAFVRLLPDGQKRDAGTLTIPPLEKTDGNPAIVARGLTRRFGDFTAVDRVSFEIQQGEIFGFLGSNGCGKTTTMKMLTGLLPASEGEAFLFGRSVDANEIETRKRVGFMSQAFSLYGELTVERNLTLHAKLFHVDRARADDRIRELSRRFGLDGHMGSLAASLPLGIRQRLSLAVAIIHEPEMLILDEPTSGVDPVARDEFWELLVELSRRDRVTIFISTHFMNEALRCDRISLMHAGRVLACDEPAHLVEAKGADTLEEAFIGYIEDAIGETEGQTTGAAGLVDAPTAAAAAPEHRQAGSRFRLSRLLAYSSREVLEIMRDPVRLAFAFLGSSILLIVISFGVSLDVEDLTYAALDLDRTAESRGYLRSFEGSRYFLEQPALQSVDELEERLRANDITLAIEIPPDFGRNLNKGEAPSVSAWIDGANTTRAAIIEGYVEGGHSTYLVELANTAGVDASAVSNVTVEPRYRYNPSFETIFSIGPKTPALLLLLFPAILMAVSMAREKEIGTISNFYVTPTNRLEYLIGKQLPYIGIGIVNFLILTVLVVFVLQVPLKGSLSVLFVGATLYVIATTGFGLLISSVTKSQVAAVFATTILSMLPTMQFAGIMQPTSTLEGGGRVIGSLWPATYYMHLSVGAFTKGLDFSDLTFDLAALALFGPVFVITAAAFLRKQEA